MIMIKSACILFCCLLLGDAMSTLLSLPIPGNVIGMILLTAALSLNIIRLDDVKPVADLLVNHLALLFVPPGVGLILYGDLLKQEWWAILTALLVSTVAVLAITGLLQQKLEKR